MWQISFYGCGRETEVLLKNIFLEKEVGTLEVAVKNSQNKNISRKEKIMNVKKEKQHVILLLSSATSLKSHSKLTIFMATSEQVLEVILVGSLLACVLSLFSTPQSTTYRRKSRLWNSKKRAAFVVYFNGSAKIPSFNFLRKSLLLRDAAFRCKRPFV